MEVKDVVALLVVAVWVLVELGGVLVVDVAIVLAVLVLLLLETVTALVEVLVKAVAV